MKTLNFTSVWVCLALLLPFASRAQCQFQNSTVSLNYTTTTQDTNCIVSLDVGFDIDINNGNKIIFVHIWRSEDYVPHTYTNQSQPKENGILGNALATIIIDNDVINSNPSAPASQVFLSTYGPDPGIDDNIPPAVHQVKDASDSLTYNRVVINAAQNIYHYTIHNLKLVIPGACCNIGQINLTGDAWSSNSNSANPPVQCSMPGFPLLVNDPVISTAFNCMPIGQSNTYSYTVTPTTPGMQLSFKTDVYVDNGDDFFDASLDTKVVADAGPYSIMTGLVFSSGVLSYPAPYATALPQKLNDLWVVVKDMVFTNSNNVPTTIVNARVARVINTCSAIVLPVKLVDFTGSRTGEKVTLKWHAVESPEFTGYTVQRKSGTTDWEDVAHVTAKGSDQTLQGYEITDLNLHSDMSLYRLRIENVDDRNDFSPSVLIPGLNNSFSYMIAPNPSIDGNVNINVSFSKNASATLYLYNLQGRLLQSLSAPQSGSYSFSALQEGTYLIKIAGDNNGFTAWSKILVLPR